MSDKEAPLAAVQRKIHSVMKEPIWFFMRRRIDLWNRGATNEVEFASAAYHRLLRECGEDESVVALILQQEFQRMEKEYEPYRNEVRRKIRRGEKLLGLEQQ